MSAALCEFSPDAQYQQDSLEIKFITPFEWIKMTRSFLTKRPSQIGIYIIFVVTIIIIIIIIILSLLL